MSSTPQAKKRKRVVLTLAEKIRIIERLEAGEVGGKLAKEYGVGTSTISDIKKAKEKIRAFVAEQESSKSLINRRTMKRCIDADLDKMLIIWFKQERSKGLPLSGPLVQAKALHYWVGLHPGEDTFTASEGWLHRWKKRHGVRRLTLCGEKLSAPTEEVEPFKKKLAKMIQEKALVPAQIYNADESGLYYRCLPDKTLASGDEKEAPGMKKQKDRVTLMFCANADGTHKIPLLIIGKFQNPRCFKGIDRERLPCTYTAQKSAWMNSFIMKDWFKTQFVPRVLKRQKMLKLPLRALLLLDNAPSHPAPEELTHKTKDGQISVLYLPPNTTSILQPMDQGPIEATKRLYRKELISTLSSEENQDTSLIDLIKGLNIMDAIKMSAKAWSDVKVEAIKKSWSKTGLWGNKTDEEEDDDDEEEEEDEEEDEDPVADFRVLIGQLPGPQLQNTDVADWLACDAVLDGQEELTDEEIKDSVTSQEEEEEEEIPCQPTGPTAQEAIQRADDLIAWLSQQPGMDPIHVLNIKSIRRMALSKATSSSKQTDIRGMFATPPPKQMEATTLLPLESRD